jgi:diguanylate cyclase (GGDEF)-like protein
MKWERHLRFVRVLAALAMLWSVGSRAAAPAPELGSYQFRSWMVEQGLPQITVNGISKDSSGALWIATEKGLVRSFGSDLEIFRSADTPTLAANWIRLLQPAGTRLYIATQKNLSWWDGLAFHGIPGSEQLGTFRQMAADPSGKLWILADRLSSWDGSRLHTYSGLTTAFSAMALQGAEPTLTDKEGRLWALRNGRLVVLPLLLPDGIQIRHLLWRKGQLWLGSAQGLYVWSPNNGELAHRVGDERTPIDHLSLDKDQRLWALSAGSVRVYEDERVVASLLAEAPNALTTARIVMAEDIEHFWVGSLTAGLRHYWNGDTRALQPEANGQALQTWSYVPTKHGLLVGTNQGIWRTDGERMEPFYMAPELKNQIAYSMLEDKEGRLWVGTRNGLHCLENGKLQRVEQLDGIQVNTLFLRSDGQVLAATLQGLHAIDGSTRQATRLFRAQLPGTVSTMYEGKDGTLWIGSAQGLWRLQGDKLLAQATSALGQSLVTALTGYGEHGVLVGTYQHGIHAIDGDKHRGWLQSDGLPSDGVGSLGQHDGWYWATHFDGVFRFQLPPEGSTEAPTMQMLYTDLGNVAGRNRIRCCNGLGRDKGYLAAPYYWAASLAGAVRTKLDVAPPTLPQVVMRKADVDGKSRDLASGVLRLLPEQRELEIGFEGREFILPERLFYRYRMTPFQSEWRQTGRRHTAYFTNLPAGDFRFEAQSSWDGQHWGPAATLEVRAEPVWHERWPVRAAGLLLAVLAIYCLVQLRLKQLEVRSRELQREIDRQTEALRAANANLEGLNQSLELASLTDPLTGLRNRRFAQQQIPGMLASLRRRRAVPSAADVLGVLLMDLDHFKRINDSYGHDIGDLVLQGAAQALRSVIRTEDHSIRWGGEEFLLLVHANGVEELWTVAARVHAALAEMACNTVAGAVTASLGVASLPLPDGACDDRALDCALQLADYALYAAKSAGRDSSALAELDSSVIWPEGARTADMLKDWEEKGRLRVVCRSALASLEI